MCLIVDANFANNLLKNTPDHGQDMKPVRQWINRGGRLVIGGKLKTELQRCSGDFINYLTVLSQQGSVMDYGDTEIDERQEELVGKCRSDDEHIIALDEISGTRLLCSHDRKLSQGFTDLKLLSNPKGKVYKNRNHKHLLHQNQCYRS